MAEGPEVGWNIPAIAFSSVVGFAGFVGGVGSKVGGSLLDMACLACVGFGGRKGGRALVLVIVLILVVDLSGLLVVDLSGLLDLFVFFVVVLPFGL